MRLAVVTNILTPYRVPLFGRLAGLDDVELVVFTAAISEPNRQWETDWNVQFEHVLLSPIRIAKRRGGAGYWPAKIGSLLRAHRVDIVVVGGGMLAFGTWLACKRLGIPMVLWSDATPDSDAINDYRLRRAVMRWLVSQAAAFIASSSRTVDYFTELGAERELIRVSLLGVDDAAFRRALVRSRPDRLAKRDALGARGVTFLYAGQLIPRKGVRELMAAWEALPEAGPVRTLLVAGDGPLMPLVRDWSGERSDVVVLGYLQESNLVDAYAAADAFCLPSRQEPFGVVFVEAVLAGLPVVATDVVGAAGDVLIDGQNAILVPPAESEALRLALLAVLDDDVRLMLASGSVSVADRLSLSDAVSEFVDACRLADTKR